MRKKQKISFARGPWGERGAERCKKNNQAAMAPGRPTKDYY
jgi:hypothetical protein